MKTRPQPVHILAVEPDPWSPKPPQPVHFLAGLREDNILDGLLGGPGGMTSGGGWQNTVTGLGDPTRDKVMQGSYQEAIRISDSELSALYNGNDIAQRIVAAKPKEMFRRGWVLVIPQESPTAGDNDDGKDAGTESGPAAPGSPLVDPMSAKVGPDGKSQAVDNTVTTKSQAAGAVAPAPGAKASGLDPDEATKSKLSEKPIAAGGPAKPEEAKTQGEGADLAKDIEQYAANLQLKAKCLEGSIFGRAFGGGLLIIGADDGQDVSTPLDEENIKSIRYLTWIDRRFVYAATWYADIGPKYGEVETWEVINPFGGQGNTRVHETRVVRFDGTPVDFLMRRRLMGWTLSVLQAPYDTMRQFDTSFQSIANLMSDMSQAVMKINGLAQLISNDQKTLNTRMAMVDMSRSSARMLYIDAENEDFARTVTPLTGVPETLEMQMLRLAAAAEMPVAILFGREPSGLNATGDADFRRFYDMIKGNQLTELEPKLRRIYTLICKAKDSPTKGVMPAKGLEFVWHKLYEPSEKEQAEIRWLMAQSDEKYVQNEILLPEEVASSRFRNGDLNLDTEIDLDLRKEKLATAELPPSGAEKAKQDQENAQAEMQIKAAGVAAKAGPPGAGAAPGAKPVGAKPKPAAK